MALTINTIAHCALRNAFTELTEGSTYNIEFYTYVTYILKVQVIPNMYILYKLYS